MTGSTIDVFRWEDPPARRHTGGRQPGGQFQQRDWYAMAHRLRAEPKRWALVLVCDTAARSDSTAKNLRRGLMLTIRHLGPFEAAARIVDGEYRVYARYVGEPTTPGGGM